MKSVTREIHYCDHCNKRYLKKGSCAIHELRCPSNPINNRDCFNCVGLMESTALITSEYYREVKEPIANL